MTANERFEKAWGSFLVYLNRNPKAQLTPFFSQLPGRCRDIFLKSRNEQLSNAEIAAEMHISVKTVEAQMSKALRRLRGLLHKE